MYVVVDTSVYAVIFVVEIVPVVDCLAVEDVVCGVLHGTDTFLQHLNRTS